MSLAALSFAAPWLLLAFGVLPLLWWLLKAVPPAPRETRFAAVRLLLGLEEREVTPWRTPWWLLLLRMATLGAVILGLAGPVFGGRDAPGDGPLLVLFEDGWGAAADWSGRIGFMEQQIGEAARAGRPVALMLASAPRPPRFAQAGTVLARLEALAPVPWSPDRAEMLAALASLDRPAQILWVAADMGQAADDALAARLRQIGPVTVQTGARGVLGLGPARLEEGGLQVALRAVPGAERSVALVALGPDPKGTERVLGRSTAQVPQGQGALDLAVDVPLEARNRITRLALVGTDGAPLGAGAVQLATDALRRRKVALISADEGGEGAQVLRPLHYLRAALAPHAQIIDAPLAEALKAAPDMILLADIARLSVAETELLGAWVEEGGVLLRFAGPRLAAAERRSDDPLLPVPLRAGGRALGGALSWDVPRGVRPFPDDSPFAGLPVPPEVTVSRQVIAEPGPELAGRVWAMLEDGTPLVTGRALGAGFVALVHVTANADWSSLPLSGLYEQMLRRLAALAGYRGAAPEQGEAEETLWRPVQLLDGFGRLHDSADRAGVPGALLDGPRGAQTPPGLYQAATRARAVSLFDMGGALPHFAPADVEIARGFDGPQARRIGHWLLALALLLWGADLLARLWLSGAASTKPRVKHEEQTA